MFSKSEKQCKQPCYIIPRLSYTIILQDIELTGINSIVYQEKLISAKYHYETIPF